LGEESASPLPAGAVALPDRSPMRIGLQPVALEHS
jgi:hypothetical protein